MKSTKTGPILGQCSWTLPNVKTCTLVKRTKKFAISQKTNSTTLEESRIEWDIGIMISNELKWTDQVNHSVLNANRLISIIKSVFTNLDMRSFKHLYGALIRPHLEYAVEILSPYLRKDISKLENLQSRVTKMVKRIKNLSYSERIKILGLHFWNAIGREEILSPPSKGKRNRVSKSYQRIQHWHKHAN